MAHRSFITGTRTQRGQALVEFALTALLFIFLLVSIIEIGHILQAYVTVQHAARQGARYAVTGRQMASYGSDPLAGWVAGSNNPLQQIPPCWPRFSDDAVAPPLGGLGGVDYNEPYRNARTCSVEETTLRAMAGLALDPHNEIPNPVDRYNAPAFYEIVVSGRVDDTTPNTGTFQRYSPPVTENYADFTVPPNDPSVTPGLVRGFAGRPAEKVVVQVMYNVPTITPVFSSFVPYLRLQGVAIMTNETFGSTSLQREAPLPPELPPVNPLGPPPPPDLVITNFVYTGPPTPSVNQSVPFTVSIQNIGPLNTSASPPGTFVVRLYATDTPISPVEAPISGPQQIGESATLGPLAPGATLSNVSITAQFPQSGVFYVYAWVDAAQVIDETGTGEGADPSRDALNVADLGTTIPVGLIADLEVSKTVDDPAPATGQGITYTITVHNAGPSGVTGIQLDDTLPSGLNYTGSSATVGSYTPGPPGVWSGIDILSGGDATLTINATVTAPDNTLIANTAQISTLPSGVIDPDPSDNASPPVALTVGAVDLAVTKAIQSVTGGPECSLSTVRVNCTVTYLITVTANDLLYNDATNVVLTDTLPANATLSGSPVPSQGSCSGTGPVTCNLGNLAAGNSATVTLAVLVTAAGNLDNTASAVAAEADGNASNNQATASTTAQPPPSADLNLTVPSATVNGLVYSPGNLVKSGDIIDYTILVSNPAGADPVSSVVVHTAFTPSTGANYQGYSATGGTTFDPVTGDWTIPITLNPGNQAQLNLQVAVASGMANQTLRLDAGITSASLPDPNTGNNSASFSIPISPVADLAVTEVVNPTAAGPGANVVYTITVTNLGPDTATNITVQDPDMVNAVTALILQPQGAVASTGTYSSSTWSIPNLGPGASATLDLTMRIIGTNPANQLNTQASILSADQTDPNTSNNADPATLQINWPPPLFVNAGNQGDSNCASLVWGAAPGVPGGTPPANPAWGIGQDYTWLTNRAYTAGSWGYVGGTGQRYTSSSPRYPDGTNVNAFNDAATYNLFACRMVGSDFYYRFDNRTPGTYTLHLVFADAEYGSGQRRFDVRTSTNGSTWTTVIDNLDVSAAAGGIRRYLRRQVTVSVPAGGTFYVRIVRDGGSISNALINGLGFVYVSPP